MREERARRYKNRVALQKPPSPHPASESETDSCSNICSPTQSLTTPPVKGETPLRKTVFKLSPVVKESTPTLEETTTNLEEVASNVENTAPCLTTANAVMETTPSKEDGDVHIGASSSVGGRLKLKRKRLITSSKEPAIKLMRVDTGGTGMSSKAITGGDKSPNEEIVKNNEVEKRSTKEVIQDTEMKDTIKEKKGAEIKEIAEEIVKEKEAVKEKHEVKQVVKEKETIKEPVKEKAVNERDVVKHVIKKTEIVNDNTEKVKKKESIKEAVKGKETVREAVKEEVKRKETVKKKEVVKGKKNTKGEVTEKDMITQPVKGRETVKEAVKDKGMVIEKEVKTSVKENGVSTNNVHDTASPRTHKR